MFGDFSKWFNRGEHDGFSFVSDFSGDLHR